MLGLTTDQLAQLITSVIVLVVMVHVILGGCAYSILLERKLSAWMQDRVGPNRVGPMGLLQPIADGLKFLFKEDYTPPGVERWLFIMAPALLMGPAMLGFAIIPWAGELALASLPFGLAARWGVEEITVRVIGANINVGIIFLLATAALGVYGVALGGWASNNKWSFFGGLRAAAQMVSYEIPMALALLAVVLTVGSIQPYDIVAHQQEGGWNLLSQPIAAILFYACMLAESNRAPFDLAEAESELIGGYHTEYSSMKFAMFFLAEYFHMITGAAFFTLLFLGGWSVNPLGIGPDLPAAAGIGVILLQILVTFTKVFLLVAFAMAVRWTLPRFRFDQLMRLAWEGMIPTATLVVLMTSLFVYLGWNNWIWLGSIGAVVMIYAMQGLMPRRYNANHRLPLAGSRFSPLRDEDVMTGPTHPAALADAPVPETKSGTVSIH